MKLSCEVISDLLPLYVENIASEDSRKLIEVHMDSCGHCKELYEKMKTPIIEQEDTTILPLKSVKHQLHRNRNLTIIMSVLITAIIGILLIGYVTSPIYVPYSKNLITFEKRENGMIEAHFNERVTHYEIEKICESESGYTYDISVWNTVLDQVKQSKKPDPVILNPDGEAILQIYYVCNNGEEDRLIYGTNLDSGQITLPRLVLSYYVMIAFLAAVCFLVLLLLFRKHNKIRKVMEYLLPIPVSYVLSHLCVKGFGGTSYSILHDFITICIIAILIYVVVEIGIRLALKRKKL